MTIRELRELVGLAITDAADKAGKTRQQIRTLEAKAPEDLTLDDVNVVSLMMGLSTAEVIESFILKGVNEYWPEHKIKFWELTPTTYKISPKATYKKLQQLKKYVKIPSMSTLYRLSRMAGQGYNKLPVKLLWVVNEFNKGRGTDE